MTKNELWKLRSEICLGSLFLSDYENSFGYTKESVCDFFDGYLDYLDEIAQEQSQNFDDNFALINALDNKNNLYSWFCCFDSFPFQKGEN